MNILSSYTVISSRGSASLRQNHYGIALHSKRIGKESEVQERKEEGEGQSWHRQYHA